MILDSSGNKVVLAMPDLHMPFEHPSALDFLEEVANVYGPTHFVNLGDEVDSHAVSGYPTNPDGMSAGAEYEAALKHMERLYKLFPVVKVCTSNHTSRPYRRAVNSGIPRVFLKEYKELLKAPKGWSWHDSIILDKVRYFHGEGFSGRYANQMAAMASMRSVVMGHVHAFGGVSYISTDDEMIFGLNAGCLIDMKAYAFAYAKEHRYRPTLGCGIVIKGTPYFIPMALNKSGTKWNGQLNI